MGSSPTIVAKKLGCSLMVELNANKGFMGRKLAATTLAHLTDIQKIWVRIPTPQQVSIILMIAIKYSTEFRLIANFHPERNGNS